MLKTLVTYSFLFFIAFPGVLKAQDFEHENHHYTLYRSWALSPSSSENPFKIVAYLPEGYLFNILEWDAEEVSGNYYTRVLTQDSVEVLLYTGAISDWTFRDALGDQELIFNARYQLCKQPSCNKNIDPFWQVARSEAFKIIEDSALLGSAVKIRATRNGQQILGYLSSQELLELTDKGLVTRTDQPLPRYRIEKQRSSVLSTACDEVRSEGQQIILNENESDDFSARILELLDMGELIQPSLPGPSEIEAIETPTIKLKKDYGDKGYLYSFYLYRVEDTSMPMDSSDRYFDAAAGYKTSCAVISDRGDVSKNYIDHMLFANERNQINGQPILVDVPSTLFNTPRDIREYTGDGYMISINKPEHFERAIEILTRKIGDRALAGYMLSELNRSCRSNMRVQYSGSVCRIYDY